MLETLRLFIQYDIAQGVHNAEQIRPICQFGDLQIITDRQRKKTSLLHDPSLADPDKSLTLPCGMAILGCPDGNCLLADSMVETLEHPNNCLVSFVWMSKRFNRCWIFGFAGVLFVNVRKNQSVKVVVFVATQMLLCIISLWMVVIKSGD